MSRLYIKRFQTTIIFVSDGIKRQMNCCWKYLEENFPIIIYLLSWLGHHFYVLAFNFEMLFFSCIFNLLHKFSFIFFIFRKINKKKKQKANHNHINILSFSFLFNPQSSSIISIIFNLLNILLTLHFTNSFTQQINEPA